MMGVRMFFVFSFTDISNAILSLVRLVILAFLFIYLPFAFLSTLFYVATSGGWYLVLGLVLAVLGFVYTTLKKQAVLSTALGLGCVALFVAILFTNASLRSDEREAIAFGSPRNMLWAESLDALNSARRSNGDILPLFPASVRAIADTAGVSTHDHLDFGDTPRRGPFTIELGHYRIGPADIFDQYIEVAEADGDWLAFHATCVLDRDCGEAESLQASFDAVESRYGVRLADRLAAHLNLPAASQGDFQTSREFAAACHADTACRTVMSALHWPVIIGASSGEPVVVHTD